MVKQIKNFNLHSAFAALKLKFYALLINGTKEAEYAFPLIGYLTFFGNLGWYVLWQYLVTQSYENFFLRLSCSLIGLPLIFYKNWPDSLKKFLPIYWYLSMLYLLSFFFIFMLLKNNFSATWQVNCMTGLMLLVLLTDWISILLLLALGSVLAIVAYICTTKSPPFFSMNILGAVANYIAIAFFCSFFMARKSKLQKEKLQILRANMVAASIAHELRTPLAGISLVAQGIQKYLTILLNTYSLARKNNLPVELIRPDKYKALSASFNNIEVEAQAATTAIDMLLMNINEKVNSKDSTICSVRNCVDKAIQRYSFDKAGIELIQFQQDKDFSFYGNEIFIIHVLFNLFKNALYQIKAAQKGKIQIWCETASKYNLLHFKDTAAGIPTSVLPHIFDRFFTGTRNGTGIGLAFCKIVMESLGGKIVCESKEGEYAEFILYFPTVKQSLSQNIAIAATE